MLCFFSSIKMSQRRNKNLLVQITTMDADLEFQISPNKTGQTLFKMVCDNLGLRESRFFGLQYVDSKGFVTWIKPHRKLKDQKLPSDSPVVFYLLVKYYPEEISDEIVQDLTLHLFYLQARQAVLNGEIYCAPEESVLLASYILQAKYGDYDTESTPSEGYVKTEKLLPTRVLEQYRSNLDRLEEHIVDNYSKRSGLMHEQAELEYLKVVQYLEMWGISYFAITNKRGTALWLGVAAIGLLIYSNDNRLQPDITFRWSEIKDLSFKHRKFYVKTNDKSLPLTYYCENEKVCKVILDLCKGNHEMYMRRRKPDTLETQQMKAQAKEDRHRRLMEREQLIVQSRKDNDKLIRDKRDCEQKILQLQDDIRRMQEKITASEDARKFYVERATILHHENVLLKQKLGIVVDQPGLLPSPQANGIFGAPFISSYAVTARTGSGEAIYSNSSSGPDTDIHNVNTEQQLNDIRMDLMPLQDEEKKTEMDKLRDMAIKRGDTKYSTLRKSKAGSTSERVNVFEQL